METGRKQVNFSIRAVSSEIDNMLANETARHLFYRVVKNELVPESHLIDVIADLQDKYRGRAVVSRSPGGIVVDRTN
jgi:hypothetical protein